MNGYSIAFVCNETISAEQLRRMFYGTKFTLLWTAVTITVLSLISAFPLTQADIGGLVGAICRKAKRTAAFAAFVFPSSTPN